MTRRSLIISILISVSTGLHAQEKLLETISYNGSSLPMVKSIYIEDPGYILAEPDSASILNGITIEFTDSVSRRTDISQTRVDFPGNISMRIYQKYNSTVSIGGTIRIKYYPMGDVLEPNDKVEQAAVILPNTWYQFNLFPNTDQDNFLIEINKAAWVNPMIQPYVPNLKWQIKRENGESLSLSFPYYAKPGKYILNLYNTSNQSSLEPLAFKVKLQGESDQLEPNDTIAAEIRMNKYYSVNLSNRNDVDNFFIRPDDGGVITIRSFQVPQGTVLFSTTLNEKEYNGNPLVIPTGNLKRVEVKMTVAVNHYDLPFFIKAEETEWLDPTESNDSLGSAVSISKSKGIYFSIFPRNDEDWFQITTTGPGTIILNLYDAVSAQTQIGYMYQLELYDTSKTMVKSLSRDSDQGIIFASGYLREAGDWFLRVTKNTDQASEQLLALRVFGPNVSGKSPTDESYNDIYFIGFELDTSSNMILTALSESADAHFTMVDSAASLEKVLSDVFADAKKRKSSGPGFWIAVSAALVLLAIGFWIYRKRFRPRNKSIN